MTQHAGLTEQRWAAFGIDQQILTIANEVHRTSRVLADEEAAARRRGYERILRLTDLTVRTGPRAALRRELLRWRDLIAELYIAEDAAPDRTGTPMRCAPCFSSGRRPRARCRCCWADESTRGDVPT